MQLGAARAGQLSLQLRPEHVAMTCTADVLLQVFKENTSSIVRSCRFKANTFSYFDLEKHVLIGSDNDIVSVG